MGRYPAEPLEDKLIWMRKRQQRRQSKTPRIEPGRVVPLPPDPPLQQQMLRVKQVAKILGVSATTVQRWFARRAVIVKGKHNRTMLIPQRMLDEWIREHTAR